MEKAGRIDTNSYKTDPCPQKEFCTNDFCVFYHYLGERRRVPFNYSQKICPNKANCFNGDMCRYSHNFHEFYYHPSRSNPSVQQNFESPSPNNQKKLDHDSLDFSAVQRLHHYLINERIKIIKTLEFKIIELNKLKDKVNCKEFKNYRIYSVKIPCGHGLCQYCSEKLVCPVCGKTTQKILIKGN